MKILVTGAHGQLGRALMRVLPARGHQVCGIAHEDADICVREAVNAVMDREKPDAVIHCAAYTRVDRAETEPEKCIEVNAIGTLYLAQAARRVGARMLYVSTDYVFSGSAEGTNLPGDVPAPCNIYGLSKLQGEEAVRGTMKRFFILRTSWLFGLGGGNFVETMLRLGAERKEIGVVADQFGSPTYAEHLAALIADMIVTRRYGIYQASNAGSCSWAEFAEAIMAEAGLKCQVKHLTTAEYGAPARRPANSRLDTACLTEAGFKPLPDWRSALRSYLAASRD